MSHLPWSSEIDRFLALLLASKLFKNVESLNDAWNLFLQERNNSEEPTVVSFCDHLISTNQLTSWQCKMLKNGQYKGFYFDDFKLIDLIKHEEACSFYKAENQTTKHFVKLRITVKDHQVSFTVEEL